MPRQQEREAMLMIATGHMGVGKSHTTRAMLEPYVKATGRKILIFDPNNEDVYRMFPSVHFDVFEVQKAKIREKKEVGRFITPSERNIRNLKPGQIRRIEPFTIFGDKMNHEQMQATMLAICQNMHDGLILLEDVNKYISNFEAEEIKGCFKAIRHQSQDMILHCQSLSPLRPIHYEATSVIRMHSDNFDAAKIRGRLADFYEPIKITQLIVRGEYMKGNTRFLCYLQPIAKKIKGVTYAQFCDAARQYLTSNKEAFRDTAYTVAAQNHRSAPVHADNVLAMEQWISQHEYYLPDNVRPAQPAIPPALAARNPAREKNSPDPARKNIRHAAA